MIDEIPCVFFCTETGQDELTTKLEHIHSLALFVSCTCVKGLAKKNVHIRCLNFFCYLLDEEKDALD